MLGLSKRETIAFVWATYFVFAELLSIGQTSEFSPCILISQENGPAHNSSYDSCASFHEGIIRCVLFIWHHATHDNIIAFGTIAIAVFTYVLYRSTDKLWLAGERHSERELRAYIMPGRTKLTQALTIGEHACVEMRFTNRGKTPAYDVKNAIKIQLVRLPVGDQLTPAKLTEDASKGSVGPGDGIQVSIRLRGPMRPLWIDAIRDGRLAIYVHGELTYRDIFDHGWTTQYRLEYGARDARDGLRFSASPEGNKAT